MGAARDLALGSRPWEQRGYDPPWVEFCLKMTYVLRSAGATPVLVFDGCRLPAKAATNQQRRARRTEARDRAQNMLQEVCQPPAAAAVANTAMAMPGAAFCEQRWCSAASLCEVPLVRLLPMLAWGCCIPGTHPPATHTPVVQGRAAEADKVFMQCIDVTADMAQELMVRLRWAGRQGGQARPGQATCLPC